VVAGVTGRPVNLGLSTDEPVGQVMGNWRAFRAAFAPRFPSVVLSHQVHGRAVQWHPARVDGWLLLDGVDGHATAEPGLLLAVTVADCVPVYLVAPGSGVVALLHAGWRGTAAGILARGVQVVTQRASVPARDLVMHCGVGICGACYGVGPEVVAALAASVPTGAAAGEVRSGASGASHVDLRALLALQARELGVGVVSVSAWCAAHDRERFFSHRASGGRDGRMAAYLGRPLPPA